MEKLFRAVGAAEAVSFIFLLGVCMPLKYVWGYPDAVRVVGMAHGLLFIGYVVLAFNISSDQMWPWKKLGLAIIAAVLPFGPFVFDYKYLRVNRS